MRKLIVLGTVASLFAPHLASAEWRGGHGYAYAPRYHEHHHNNAVPYVLGGVALGVLGALAAPSVMPGYGYSPYGYGPPVVEALPNGYGGYYYTRPHAPGCLSCYYGW